MSVLGFFYKVRMFLLKHTQSPASPGRRLPHVPSFPPSPYSFVLRVLPFNQFLLYEISPFQEETIILNKPKSRISRGTARVNVKTYKVTITTLSQ